MKSDSNTELAAANTLNDESVARYLTDNPEFFNRQAELLLELTIPHESGSAISLLERQVTLFRERNLELQNNINEFIFNAEENDALFEKTRIVILDLLKTSSLSELATTIEHSLCSEFAAHAGRLIFISDSLSSELGNMENIGTLSEAPAQETLGKLYVKIRTFCCELTPEQARMLFPESMKEILSAAIIPVHLDETVRDAKGTGVPLLVIGSEKHNHFNTSLDTLFLDFIGEILAAHITRLLA